MAQATQTPTPNTVVRYANGQVCHTTFCTNDIPATQNFLSEVLGWSTFEVPVEGEQPYLMVNDVTGNTIGGIGPLMEGAPGPSVCSYVQVANIHDTVKLVESNGGTLLGSIIEVPNMGSLVHFQIPGGPVFGCWQDAPNAQPPTGANVVPFEPVRQLGRIIGRPFGSTNVEATKAFCENVFGWTFETIEAPDGHTAYLYDDCGGDGGVLYAWDPSWEGSPYCEQHILVNDIDTFEKEATAKGATVIGERWTLEGRGTRINVQIPNGPAIQAWQDLGN